MIIGRRPRAYNSRLISKNWAGKRLGAQYDGHPSIDHVDLGSVGWWGEWHMSGAANAKMPAVENQRKIVDAYLGAFKKTPLLMLIGGGTMLEYATKHGTGWRADCLGDKPYRLAYRIANDDAYATRKLHTVHRCRRTEFDDSGSAAEKYADVIAVTHVPPFREAAWYEGRTSDDNFLPHFSCKAAGDAMLRVMNSNPQCNLLVLCGHTHGSGEANLLNNLKVLTGKAVYGSPEVQRVFEVE
jgi:hypothetical protein